MAGKAMRHVQTSMTLPPNGVVVTPRGMSTQAGHLENTRPCSRGSLAEESLDLGVERLPLRGLTIHRTEPFDSEFLARLLTSVVVLLEAAVRIPLFGPCGSSFAHDLARRILGQRCLGQAAYCLFLFAFEHRNLGPLTTCDLLTFFDLHSLHGFHGLHPH